MPGRVESMSKRNKCQGGLGRMAEDLGGLRGRAHLEEVRQGRWGREGEWCEGNKMELRQSLFSAFLEPFSGVSSLMSCLPSICSLCDKRDLGAPPQKPSPRKAQQDWSLRAQSQFGFRLRKKECVPMVSTPRSSGEIQQTKMGSGPGEWLQGRGLSLPLIWANVVSGCSVIPHNSPE